MKQHRYVIGIIVFITCLLLLCIPYGDAVFGSNVDWLNQHVRIAQHIRDACYAQETLLPDYSSLGGGSNMFMFAYYGILRLDILISLLLPHVEMQTILIAYAIASMYASCLLCYFWLKRQGITPWTCFISTLLLACATCFFQLHRQLMFINYLPFLCFLLYAVDKKKSSYLVLVIIGIFTHSFMFSISCFIVGMLYVQYKSYSWKQYLLAWMLACSLCALLLVPSALAILEQHKDVGKTNTLNLLSLQFDMKNFLYSPYGCGLSVLSVYSLLYGIYNKKTRRLSISISILTFCSLCSYILNATLYVRSKIYIPFVVIFILLIANALDDLKRTSISTKRTICIILVCLLCVQSNIYMYMLDLLLLCIFLYVHHVTGKRWLYIILLLFPIGLSIITHHKDTYITKKQLQQPFQDSQLQSFYTSSNYRFDMMNDPLTNANYLPLSTMKKSTMYSSTMNEAYSQFYYDIMKTPISIKNRVALLANSNPFLQHMMSIRYLQTKADNIPIGYTIKQQKGSYVLAENKHVKPMLYATSQLMSEQQYQSYSFPYNLDTLCNRAIVKKAPASSYTSQIKQLPTPLALQKDIKITNKKTQKQTITLPKVEKDQILIVSFDVVSPQGKEVSIRIHGIQNKLSAATANYPNHHKSFVYYLSDLGDTQSIQLSKGSYTIQHMNFYSIPYAALQQQKIQPIKLQKQTNPSLLQGEIDWQSDGYVITSIPYQRGYRVEVDGKQVAIEKVNHAFIGFPLTKGFHTIQLVYQAPGTVIGRWISSIAVVLSLILLYKKRKKEHL